MRTRHGFALAAFLMVATIPASAEEPARDPFAPVRSMGLPVRRAPYAGLSYVSDQLDHASGSHPQLFFGYSRDVKQPAVGALGGGLEGYAGPDAFGLRALLSIRALRLKTGLDFSSDESGGEWLITLEDPILRGGFPLRGTTTRLEWIPARHHFGLGLSVPLFQPWIGRTRPRQVRVEMSDLPEDARQPLHLEDARPDARLTDSAEWIDFLTTPHDPEQLKTNEEWMRFVERVRTKMQAHDADHPDGRGLPQEIAAYHHRLRELFQDDSTCDMARRVLFERLVAPFDAEFGRLRDDRVFAGLCASARQGFADWCDTAGVLPSASHARALASFDQVLAVLSGVERQSHRRWDDTRKIWLALDLVLRPEEHDSQHEIDSILERVVGEPFVGGNTYEYLVNEAFSPALIRSIHQAQSYHVLWIHDFPGLHKSAVDSVGCSVVTQGYLSALASAVRRLDEGHPLPSLIVLLDQWYFDGRKGQWWMSILDDPLDDSCPLPASAVRARAELSAARARLRAAVDSSRTLSKLRAERGEAWLHKFVRVNVNVTFPGDPTFAGRKPVPSFLLKFSDDYMRDHSKLVFWDLTEQDPAAGGALITGEGVGENYEGSRWEDRTLLLRGPGALEFKRRARELLLSQGIRASELPLPLGERLLSPHWDARVDSLVRAGNTVRVLQAFNGTGYQRKSASAAKAALYNLMPAGSRLLAPDSQWTSYFWAGMLVGAALRGLNVYVVAAKPANAPYDSAMVQSVLTHDVLEGYIQLRMALAAELAASGGTLNVGIYGEGIGTRSLVNRYRSAVGGMLRPTFPRSAFPFSPATYAALGDTARLLRLMRPLLSQPLPVAPVAGEHPKLHLKSQFFASGPGLTRALGAANWDSVFSLYVALRIRATREDPSQAGTGMMSPSLLAPIRSVVFDAPPESSAADVFYLTIGSHNQNDRSLLLDGEVLCLLSGPEALAPMVDFTAIAGRSEWIMTTDELDRAIPRRSRRDVKWARRLRSLF